MGPESRAVEHPAASWEPLAMRLVVLVPPAQRCIGAIEKEAFQLHIFDVSIAEYDVDVALMTTAAVFRAIVALSRRKRRCGPVTHKVVEGTLQTSVHRAFEAIGNRDHVAGRLDFRLACR